ncbi:MAG: hypothetical protein LW850_32960 [Planctomycetaceae bacterium]|nr:hypothetical protein [Planctomycetaceae bacterium]
MSIFGSSQIEFIESEFQQRKYFSVITGFVTDNLVKDLSGLPVFLEVQTCSPCGSTDHLTNLRFRRCLQGKDTVFFKKMPEFRDG